VAELVALLAAVSYGGTGTDVACTWGAPADGRESLKFLSCLCSAVESDLE